MLKYQNFNLRLMLFAFTIRINMGIIAVIGVLAFGAALHWFMMLGWNNER